MALLKEQGPMAGMNLKKLVMDETGCSKRTVERAHTFLVKEKKIQTKRVRRQMEAARSLQKTAMNHT